MLLPYDGFFDGSWHIQPEARIPFPIEEMELSNVPSDTAATGVANTLRVYASSMHFPSEADIGKKEREK